MGQLAKLGITELFFETVEPANEDIPLQQLLNKLPAGNYNFTGKYSELSEFKGIGTGTATLTHDIPKGAVLVSPAEDAEVPVGSVRFEWQPVTEPLNGDPITIISYQLIVEKDEPPQLHMIGAFKLDVHLKPDVTGFDVGAKFFEPGTDYIWEVLAIEESGNQTISEGSFTTAE